MKSVEKLYLIFSDTSLEPRFRLHLHQNLKFIFFLSPTWRIKMDSSPDGNPLHVFIFTESDLTQNCRN